LVYVMCSLFVSLMSQSQNDNKKDNYNHENELINNTGE